jgi:hypothetical protein
MRGCGRVVRTRGHHGSCRGKRGVRRTDRKRSHWDHIARSPDCSIRKAQRLLEYSRYRSLDALRESVAWLAGKGAIDAHFPAPAPGWTNLVKECR